MSACEVAWCDGNPRMHPGLEQAVHSHDVGTLGVAVEQAADDDAPTVYEPVVNGDGILTAPLARQLAADLIEAADVIEGR